MKRLIALAIIALLFTIPAVLQEVRDCDTDSIHAAMQTQLDALEDDPAAALTEIVWLAVDGLFACSNELPSYSGRQGAQPVLGPLTLHAGYYVVTLKTDGAARVDATALDGCGKDMDSTLFNISAGQAVLGAENLVQIESDCVAYLELSKITAPWSLEMEKIR